MSDRVWVVTGTNSGLGLAVAQYLLAQGDKVVATVRSLAKFPESLKAAGAQPLIMDLCGKDEEIRKAAEDAIKVFGHVDILVNNAGSIYSGVGPVEELEITAIRNEFQINVFANITFTQPFIEHFRTRRSGTIINLSSIGAVTGYPSFGAYTAAKAAMDIFTDALAAEVAPYGVKVWNLVPGYFPTNVFRSHPLSSSTSSNGVRTGVIQGDNPTLSKVYTEPSQGYDLVNHLPRGSHEKGQIGDPDKFAVRIYEVGTNTGLAKEVLDNSDKKLGIRIPVGSDVAGAMLWKYGTLIGDVQSTETFWKSTDVEPERLHEFAL